jgi:hypothetical protein
MKLPSLDTGDPNCPPRILRAKLTQNAIENYNATLQLDEAERGSETESEDEEGDTSEAESGVESSNANPTTAVETQQNTQILQRPKKQRGRRRIGALFSDWSRLNSNH